MRLVTLMAEAGESVELSVSENVAV